MAQDYDGRAVTSGPALARDVGIATIRKLAVSPMANNCYLITSATGGAQVLIDAADDAPRLLRLLREGEPSGRLDAIVTTHAHADHTRALAALAGATGAPCYAGAADIADLPLPAGRVIPLADGEELRAGDLTFAVIALRGHTAGSIALALTGAGGTVHLFTGDSLFPGGVGNTWGDPARFESLITDVEERIFARYRDDTWVYPGHGDDTTLGAERPALASWRERGW